MGRREAWWRVLVAPAPFRVTFCLILGMQLGGLALKAWTPLGHVAALGLAFAIMLAVWAVLSTWQMRRRRRHAGAEGAPHPNPGDHSVEQRR